MARTPQTISPNAARKRPQAHRQAPRRRALARAPQTISPNATRKRPQAHRQARKRRPKSPQRFIRLPLARRMNPFFIPRPQKCSPHRDHQPSRTALKQPKHHRRAPKARPFSLPKAPQNHPFAWSAKAASVNSYSKSAISYNAPPKVLPLTGACLLLHCHQDSNEIQIKK